MIDVVIPAHDESALIEACLWSVLDTDLDVKIIVVANGCTDDTAAIAARTEGVVVVEIPQKGKAAALNAAEPHRRGCSVIYLDADTVLTPGTVRALAEALDTPEPRVAAPEPMLVRPKTWLTRGFARVWSSLPAVKGQVIGGGCYAVNPAGRARWEAFPDVVADDAFVRTQFSAHEQILAGGFLLVLPEGRELIAVTQRWRSGNAALPTSPSAGARQNLASVLRQPQLWPAFPAFAAVRIAGRARLGWARAESLRTAGTTPAKVDAIVVVYKSADTIDACLASIRSARAELTITVVDNNSDNIGFAKAVNNAATQGKGDYLLLVNPDAELDPDAIDHLLTLAARFPDAGLYGGRAIDGAGRLDPTSCLAAPTLWHALLFAVLRDQDSLGGWRRDDIRSVPALTGAFLLIHKGLWERLGGFDERYFLYGEDVDLCLRARHRGATPMFTPAAGHLHHGGGSSTPEQRLVAILRGKATLYKTYARPAALAQAALLIGVATRASAAKVVGRGHVWRTAWRQRDSWRDGYQSVL